MPSFLSLSSKFLRKVDLFPTSKLLRYNGQTDYTTTTGGLISIAVVAILFVLFASMGIKTVRKQLITAQIFTQKQIEPSQLKFTADSQGGLMFMLYLYGFNMSAVPRLFDYALYQETYTTGAVVQSSVKIPMVQCTQQHFNFTSEMVLAYNKLQLSSALCPPLGQQFTVRGKISSDLYSHFLINITRCNSTADPTCANDTVFSTIQTAVGGRFRLVIPLITTNLNPASQNYREFFFDDNNIFSITSQLGLTVVADVQNDVIQTDNSLMPFTAIESQSVNHMPEPFGSSYFVRSNTQPNVQIVFRKSTKTVTYSRFFNKIDNYLSYVGGLMGTIIALIFIMGPYTQKTYEISLAKKVLLDDDKNEIKSQSFNLGYFFLMSLKQIFEFFKFQLNWPKVQNYIDSSQQLSMQIDITYIVRKMMFLDAAISKIMEKHEIEALCMREKPTLSKAKEMRKKHFAPQLIRNKQEINSEEKQKQHQIMGELSLNKFMKEMVEESPCQLVKPNAQSEDDDVSALDFSRKDVVIDSIKASVAMVVQEQKQGNSRSKNIMEEMIPNIFAEILSHGKPQQKQKQHHQKIQAKLQIIEQSEFSEEDRTDNVIKIKPLDRPQKHNRIRR